MCVHKSMIFFLCVLCVFAHVNCSVSMVMLLHHKGLGVHVWVELSESKVRNLFSSKSV